jgi:hypothetical protein
MKQSGKMLRHSFPAEFGRARLHPLPQNHRPVRRHFSDLFFMRHYGLFFWLTFSRNNRLRSGKLFKNECHHWQYFPDYRGSIVPFWNKMKKLSGMDFRQNSANACPILSRNPSASLPEFLNSESL